MATQKLDLSLFTFGTLGQKPTKHPDQDQIKQPDNLPLVLAKEKTAL